MMLLVVWMKVEKIVEICNNMDSLVPVYIFVLIFSVSLVFFKAGTYYCDNAEKKVEYRFIPRTHEELEKETQASDALQDMV